MSNDDIDDILSDYYLSKLNIIHFLNKSGEQNMSMQINFKNDVTTKQLYFADLPLNSAFRIKTSGSKGAIYIKTQEINHFSRMGSNNKLQTVNHFRMYEIATGKLFEPTPSPVELVSVKIEIDAERPEVYR